MLRLIIGKAGAGKTAEIINEINKAVEKKEPGRILLVPEQYSHEAERELCRKCGDSLSLYAEVLSFTGLARRVMSKQGGSAGKYLDKGGRLLCMALALNNISSRLKIYNKARGRAEMQAMLLSAIDELKSACVSPDELFEAAGNCGGALGDKLSDLALIAVSYDAVVSNGRADPSDRLTVLAEQILDSDFGPDSFIYVDGFIDFTNQELAVLRALMKKGAKVCVCLTVDELRSDSEIYELSRISCRRLIAQAKELGTEIKIESMEAKPGKKADLAFFADNMFSYGSDRFQGEGQNISLYTADSITAECELAAARVLELVREKGLRWRDIAIAVRGFEDYRGVLENTFALYGVPLYTARKSSLLQKPLPALISLAYEITQGGWETDELISYMKTGLTGLSDDDCDLLSDYIFLWQLKSSAWHRKNDWSQHPEGYGAEETDESREKLWKINSLRCEIAGPLLSFQRSCEESHTAETQAAALSQLLAELKLPEKMQERAERLEEQGRKELSQEYRQLWDIIVNAIEQSAAVLGDSPMETEEFGKLFSLMLSKYDVGSIPVSLDRVSAGDFDRMRRRSIKELIVLGCSDDRMPRSSDEDSMFSDEERKQLLEMDIDLGGGSGELWREFSLIYNCLSLPSEGLTLSYPAMGAEGDSLRACYPYNRAAALFGIKPQKADMELVHISAPAPALSLAANAFGTHGPAAESAAEYFKDAEPEKYEKLRAAAGMYRGKLSPEAVEKLYGRKIRLSASRIDKFATCKFAYFCQYGLRAKPYEPAGFKPPEVGTFMHYILENTARDVKKMGGFKKVSDEELHSIAEKYINEYIRRELNDFREKSRRFVYLFRRLCKDVQQIVSDMADELRRSDFEPMDFELDFAEAQDIEAFETGEDSSLSLAGIADRVDGWLHEDKLYVRVVDYKTGRKKFSLSDVWYGLGMQMLLYLFTLQEGAEKRYGHEIVPAGVIYVPARNAILSLSSDAGDDEADKKRKDELKRSGLVLNDEAVLEAWEKGEDKRYIPVKFRGGTPTEDTVASLERMGILSKHIKKTLSSMADELRHGSIAADPLYQTQQENACMNCDYFEACHFSQGENGESCRFRPKLSDKKVWELMEGGEEDG